MQSQNEFLKGKVSQKYITFILYFIVSTMKLQCFHIVIITQGTVLNKQFT